MATETWTAANGAEVEFIGQLSFQDVELPVMGKNEWGIDTLQRTVRGPGSQYATFMATLDQGDTFSQFGKTWYLQTWGGIADKIFPGASLNYIGIWVGVGSLDPQTTTSRSELLSTISADGLSISYNGKTIVAGTRQIKYVAPQTTYRYITSAEPSGATYNTIVGNDTIEDLSSSITVTFDDGTTSVLAGTAPAGLASALSVTPATFITGPSFSKIEGTIYWMAEDVVQMKYPDS